MRPYQLVRRAPAMAVLLVIAAIALALPGPAVHAEEPSAALLLLVAQEYARTGDADAARAALAGWDAAEVDAALARAAETGDMEAAAGLQALRDVLADDAAPFRPQTLLTDVWVRIGLVVSGTLVLTAGLAALLPAGPVPRPTTNRRKDAATDALAGLTPEDLLRLLALAEAGRSASAATDAAGGASEEVRWQQAAADVSDEAVEAGTGERIPPPAVQQAPTVDKGPKPTTAAPAARTASWQPTAPVTGSAAAQATETGTAQPAPEGAPASGSQQAQSEVTPPSPQTATAPHPLQAQPEAAPQPAMATLPAEQKPDEEAADTGLLSDLFQADVDDSQVRHVLTRDLLEIDCQELAAEAQAVAEALARRW